MDWTFDFPLVTPTNLALLAVITCLGFVIIETVGNRGVRLSPRDYLKTVIKAAIVPVLIFAVGMFGLWLDGLQPRKPVATATMSCDVTGYTHWHATNTDGTQAICSYCECGPDGGWLCQGCTP